MTITVTVHRSKIVQVLGYHPIKKYDDKLSNIIPKIVRILLHLGL